MSKYNDIVSQFYAESNWPKALYNYIDDEEELERLNVDRHTPFDMKTFNDIIRKAIRIRKTNG
jgi:hypothetical protein